MNEVEQVEEMLAGRRAIKLSELKDIIGQLDLDEEVVLWGKYVITRNKAIFVVEAKPNFDLELAELQVQLWSSYTELVEVKSMQSFSSWLSHSKCYICRKTFCRIAGNEYITPQGIAHVRCGKSLDEEQN